MKEFIKRNFPVFAIGLATLVIFIGIILLAQRNTVGGPELQKVQEEVLIAEHTPTTGNPEAPVVLVEFSDFGCPACRSFFPLVKELADTYPQHLKVAWRHFPLPQHQNAKEASIAAQAAKRQDKFWEYAQKLYENQGNFDRESLFNYANEIGLDISRFEQDYQSVETQNEVNGDLRVANSLNLNATPTFFLNGEILKFGSGVDFENLILEELKKHTQIVSDVTENSGEETFNPDPENNITDETGDNQTETDLEETDETTESADTSTSTIEEQFDARYGVINISYTVIGFNPDNLNAIQGQKVVFTNNTDEKMRLEQIIRSYEQLKTPALILPGESYELRLTIDKLWTFKESDHRHYGSIFVLPPKDKSLMIPE